MAEAYLNGLHNSLLASGGVLKRPRTDYGVASALDLRDYYPQEAFYLPNQALPTSGDPRLLAGVGAERSGDARLLGGIGAERDARLLTGIGAERDARLLGGIGGERSGDARLLTGLGLERAGGITGLPVLDSGALGLGRSQVLSLDHAANDRELNFPSNASLDALPRKSYATMSLPPDASSTLYVEGFPSDCSKREVAHIFRPFLGFKELRLVNKEHRDRDITLCFVDFESAAHADAAMNALQGYRVDKDDPESKYLRLQFSRNPPPPRSSGGRRR